MKSKNGSKDPGQIGWGERLVMDFTTEADLKRHIILLKVSSYITKRQRKNTLYKDTYKLYCIVEWEM